MTKDEALVALKAAYDAADDALVQLKLAQAAGDPAATDDAISDCDARRQHALLCYLQALNESLAIDNAHTAQIKSELDAQTAQLQAELGGLKRIAEIIKMVDGVVKLAGSLASAFA